MRLFFVRGYVSIAVGVKESFTTWFFSQYTSIQFGKHRPLSLRVISQTPLLSAYRVKTNSSKTHGFSSSTYLTLHPAERRDVMLFFVDFGLVLALLRTLNQTDLTPYKFHESYLSGSGAQSR